jgi:thioredoxin reductase (NADPH)
MNKATIVTVDDDPAVSQAVARDLRRRYGADYRIVRSTSGAEALDVLRQLALRGRPVALIASDQRMPSMTGVQFLEQAREHAPDAKLVLLTAYADTEVAIRAINDIGLDHYLLKPWDPPEEHLYPTIDDLLDDWRREHPGDAPDVRVIGHRWSERTHEIRTFLTRNHIHYQWLDVDADEEAVRPLQRLADANATEDLPLVLPAEGDPLRAPTTRQLADALGLRTIAEQPLYDLCIVGAGPAGLAAAVYGASEGLRTVVIEREAPGGQAGQSALIENYLGFPRGLSGADLSQKAEAQGRRFGAEMVVASDVVGMEPQGAARIVRLADGATVEAQSVVIATGVSYQRLDAPGIGALTGRGCYYGVTASEASQCAGDDVCLVGAGNSAGQAAVNLARHARRVVLLVRGGDLARSMSHYLIEKIDDTPNIEVSLNTEVTGGTGDGHLETLLITDRTTGIETEMKTNWLFVFIGASPHTSWLGDDVVRDERGFLLTGNDLLACGDPTRWPLRRAPFPLETSVPGVFAAGDVRLDSMKRVASAVGEGAMAVHFVHKYLTAT